MKKLSITIAVILFCICGFMFAIWINSNTPNRTLAVETAEPEYCFFKLEPDGDYALIWQNEDGWHYVQLLGGDVVELRSFVSGVEEADIVVWLGDRLDEFERTEAIGKE